MISFGGTPPGAGSARSLIGAPVAGQLVVAFGAGHDIVAFTRTHGVVSGAGVNQIVAPSIMMRSSESLNAMASSP